MKPTHAPGHLATLRAAAELTGIPRERLESLIRSGAIRTERIKRETFIDIDEAERVEMGGEPCRD